LVGNQLISEQLLTGNCSTAKLDESESGGWLWRILANCRVR
jgi:hypothetical protein